MVFPSETRRQNIRKKVVFLIQRTAQRQHKQREASHDPSHDENARALEEHFRNYPQTHTEELNNMLLLFGSISNIDTFHPCVKASS